MDIITEIRRNNVEKLMDEFMLRGLGNKTDFAIKCGYNRSFFSQLIGVNANRNIGNKVARKIEVNLGLPAGYLDKKHSEDNVNTDGLTRVNSNALLSMNSVGVIENVVPCEGFLLFYSKDPTTYAMKITGDKLFPRVNSGEFIILEPSIPPEPGDEVLFKTLSGQIMIKRLDANRDGFYRFSEINSSSNPLTIDCSDISEMTTISAIVKPSRLVELV